LIKYPLTCRCRHIDWLINDVSEINKKNTTIYIRMQTGRRNVFLRRHEMVEQAKISNISVFFPAFNDGVNVYMWWVVQFKKNLFSKKDHGFELKIEFISSPFDKSYELKERKWPRWLENCSISYTKLFFRQFFWSWIKQYWNKYSKSRFSS